jgi:hypothetical protein
MIRWYTRSQTGTLYHHIVTVYFNEKYKLSCEREYKILRNHLEAVYLSVVVIYLNETNLKQIDIYIYIHFFSTFIKIRFQYSCIINYESFILFSNLCLSMCLSMCTISLFKESKYILLCRLNFILDRISL